MIALDLGRFDKYYGKSFRRRTQGTAEINELDFLVVLDFASDVECIGDNFSNLSARNVAIADYIGLSNFTGD